MSVFNIKNSIYLSTSLLLLSGFLRFYNIGREDLWFDEMVSFWVADPEISILETFNRHFSTEAGPIIYNLFLKFFFELTKYDPAYGRSLSSIFNILGIYLSFILCSKITNNNNSKFLFLFFASINIYLIIYSQEIRPYSMIFFLLSLYLLAIHHLIYKKNLRYFEYILFYFIQTLLILTHQFCLLIFFAVITYLIFNFILNKKRQKNLELLIFFSLLTYLIYNLFFNININNFPEWITQPDIKFYTNFYFSKFFGSRILGIIHFIILIILIYRYKKKLAEKELVFFKIFILIIIISYSLPIIYGYVFRPIIFPRYLIYLLIPILLIISIFLYKIKNTKMRNLIIIFLIILNFGNLLTESTIQQFYKDTPLYKPDIKNTLKTISNSNNPNYFIDISDLENQNQIKAIAHYLNFVSSKFNFNTSYISKEKIRYKNEVWTICLTTISKDNCKITNNIFKDEYKENIYYSNINLKKLDVINEN